MLKTKLAMMLVLAGAMGAACDSGKTDGKEAVIPGTEGYDPEKIELAKKSNCFSCHAMEKKMIGPSFKDIAAKYRGTAAEENLVFKVARGSSGAWGSIPMPANSPPVAEADIRAVVKFILSL